MRQSTNRSVTADSRGVPPNSPPPFMVVELQQREVRAVGGEPDPPPFMIEGHHAFE